MINYVVFGLNIKYTRQALMGCRKSAGRYVPHSALNDVITRALTSAQALSRLEPASSSRPDGERPDVWRRCRGCRLQGRCLVLEVTMSWHTAWPRATSIDRADHSSGCSGDICWVQRTSKVRIDQPDERTSWFWSLSKQWELSAKRGWHFWKNWGGTYHDWC